MKPRSQLIMWAAILLALIAILLDKLHNSPTVTNHRENLARSDQRNIELAGVLSERNQFGIIEKLQEESPINVDSETPNPPVLGVNVPVSQDIYVVQENDTLGDIAQRHDLDVDSLLHANELQNPNKIRYGQELRIPLQLGVSHIVKENDTLGSIAHQYGVSLRSIVNANSICNEDLIHPDAKLRIPGAKLPRKP